MSSGAQSKFEELRSKAEKLLKGEREKAAQFSDVDILSLIHELEVHEIELQLQNEELRRARLELEGSRKAYADLYDRAPAGYVTTNAGGIITSANRAAAAMLGASKKYLLDRGFSSFVHSQDHAHFFALLNASARGMDAAWPPGARPEDTEPQPEGPGGPANVPGEAEGPGISAAGSRLARSDSARSGGGTEQPGRSGSLSGQAGEIRILKAGVAPFYARLEVAPALDEHGAFAGWLIVFSDISDRKAAEEQLKSYAEKLERSNGELQEFAFIASHDLQEPLRKIQAFGQMLSKKYSPALGEEGADYIDRMCRATGRLQDMVRGLLDYSRVFTEGKGFASVDLGQIVREVLSDLEWQIKRSGAEVRIENLPVVQADANQMRRLFQNLISNSLKFRSRERPIIKIYGGSEPLQAGCAALTLPGGSSRGYRLFVEDNGIGFDQEHAERIFSLFERLHGRSLYEGSGIGLAICRRIVERHGGAITASGRPGRGATFVITLPA